MSENTTPKPAVRKPEPIEAAEAFERRVQEENNAKFQELRDQAQATLAAVKGSRAIRGPNGWEILFEKAQIGYQSGRFLLEQLGAERLLTRTHGSIGPATSGSTRRHRQPDRG